MKVRMRRMERLSVPRIQIRRTRIPTRRKRRKRPTRMPMRRKRPTMRRKRRKRILENSMEFQSILLEVVVTMIMTDWFQSDTT